MRALCIYLAASFALIACGKKDQHALPSDEAYAASSSPPPVQIANAMGACEDMEVCTRECDAGAGDRCRRVGVSYEFGKGAPKDPKQAIAWYEKACSVGNALGCEAAGRMYEYHAERKDPTLAAAYYKRSCELGWQGGCANWAIMLENGRGVPRDLGKAKSLYDGACKAGAGLACDRLKVLSADAATAK